MSRSTFRVLFYLKRNAPKKNGQIPVMCRITVNGKVSQFSSKLDVEEKMWNVETGRLSGRSLTAQEGNCMLDKIRVGINKAYQEVCDTDSYVTAEKVRNAESERLPEVKQALEALKEAEPQRIAFEYLDFNFGERWFPTGVYAAYMSWLSTRT